MEKWDFVGIDYGSKVAGTTVIAWQADGQICYAQSEKKRDADRFLIEQVAKLKAKHIFLDAPLSLPGVYRDLEDYEDYFYRKADKELKAMSPMFLGGLTARAMKLKAMLLAKYNCQVYETYPAALAIELEWKSHRYKKEKEALEPLSKHLSKAIAYPFEKPLENWHQFDAVLALLSGKRFFEGKARLIGNKKEGQIVF